MKKSFILISLIVPFMGWAVDSTNSPAPAKIGAKAASQHYDQLLTVTGTVAQVSIRPAIVFINLDQPYPDSPFAAIIHPEATNQFGNLKSLKGKAVEITGKITNYHDRPEIILENSNQLVTISGSMATNPPAAPKNVKSAGGL